MSPKQLKKPGRNTPSSALPRKRQVPPLTDVISLLIIHPKPYKRRSQAMKEAREKEHDAYMRSLSPEDIKRENAFRAAQRKAGKSRKSNLKDRNAPKKPLSAYFMFLQQIRANPKLVSEIFGDESETTKQSVLAAAKWRSMTDAERQVSISVLFLFSS